LPGKAIRECFLTSTPTMARLSVSLASCTLTAGLNDAREVPETQRPSVDPVTGETPVGEMDDHALLEATRTGDELAFQEIVRRYRNLITNFVYRMLNDYDRAVDLAQETFLRVFMNAERYQANYRSHSAQHSYRSRRSRPAI